MIYLYFFLYEPEMLFRICFISTFKPKSIYITSKKNPTNLQLQNHLVKGAVIFFLTQAHSENSFKIPKYVLLSYPSFCTLTLTSKGRSTQPEVIFLFCIEFLLCTAMIILLCTDIHVSVKYDTVRNVLP